MVKLPDDRYGTIDWEDLFGSLLLGFRRTLPYPRAKVWDHLFDKKHLTNWITSEPGGFIRRHYDGEIHLPTNSGAIIQSRVGEFEPETLLAFAWGTDFWLQGIVWWELDTNENGTVLEFEHSLPDRELDESYAQLLASWHIMLDRFEASMAHAPVPWSADEWQRLVRIYGRLVAVWNAEELAR